MFRRVILYLACILMTSCDEKVSVITGVDERQANQIVVFLASKGVEAEKMVGIVKEDGSILNWKINVSEDDRIKALAVLNHVGLPRKFGATLLQLFAKEGFISTEREEQIRFQSGLATELANTIKKIDGILDAVVWVSLPQDEAGVTLDKPQDVCASVYIKHDGILQDPNFQLESKIKRLVSASVPELEYGKVSVVSDRSRFTDTSLFDEQKRAKKSDNVMIWSMMMSKDSVLRFKCLFAFLVFLLLASMGGLGWLVYLQYPRWVEKKQVDTTDIANPKEDDKKPLEPEDDKTKPAKNP